MKITFLGTGTSQGIPVIGCNCSTCQSKDPKDKRLRCSIWIQVEGQSIVIDVGPDFRQQMLAAAVDRIDAIFITHEHRDHIAGLDDIRPFNFKYNMDMPVYATKKVQQELKKGFAYIFEASYPGVPMVVLHELVKDQSIDLKGLKIQPIEYFHAELPVMGFRIGNFAYLTDFKTIKADQLDYLEGLDVLVISALQHSAHHSHLSLREALRMIEKIGPKKAYLTHISHNMGPWELNKTLLPPNVSFAYDGLELALEHPLD